MAYPDPDRAPPRQHSNKAHKVINKTPTGEAIAIKIRDMRLRRALTGSTAMPRLTRKTHPKSVDVAEEADVEEEIAAYEQGDSSAQRR